MAACRVGVKIAPDLGSAARGHVARIQTLGTPSSVLISQSLNFKCNRQNCVSGPSKSPQSMSVRAITEVASEEGYEGSVSAEEMLRKADSYFATDTRPIILFDGVCNFCNAGVNFVLDNDPEGRLRMAALQSEAGKALLLRSGRSTDNISSLVLVEKDGSYIKSEGVLRSAKYLGNLLPPLGSFGLLLPLFFRDFVYDNVADNRYSVFGRRNVCRVSDERFNDRFVM